MYFIPNFFLAQISYHATWKKILIFLVSLKVWYLRIAIFVSPLVFLLNKNLIKDIWLVILNVQKVNLNISS
jgi:hypothetical protein